MNRLFWMTMLVIAVATAPVRGQDVTEEQLKQAHHDLQQALETIKAYHLVGHEPFEAAGGSRLDLLIDARKARMGVLVVSVPATAGGVAGAMVRGVTPGGPADDAGLEAGDVITRIDGVALAEGDGLPHEVLIDELGRHDEGDVVVVDFSRQGAESTVSVELRSLPNHDVLIDRFAYPPGGADLEFHEFHHLPEGGWFVPHVWLDMEMASLNPELEDYFGVDQGVLVLRGPGDDSLPLRGGDVIVAIDGRVVTSPTHAMRILQSYQPDETMVLEIVRHGRRESMRASVPDQRVNILESWDD